MRRVLVCREYPPAPGGGIGTYAWHAAQAFAEAGDTVHVIGQRWPGADQPVTEAVHGRLIVHRLPVETPGWLFGVKAHPQLDGPTIRALYRSGGAAAAFAWQVAERIDRLAAHETIDLIEGPDYEAPLFVLQLRRAASWPGTPVAPCVVHLHSPTALVAKANGTAPEMADATVLARLEHASIATADALLCPSRFLADQVADHYRLDRERITVVPYPHRSGPALHRVAETWRSGTILYVGRLELRKGIVEWIRAAVRLGHDDPSLRFAFVGSDHVDAQLGRTGVIDELIPAAMRSRFTFHDHRDREAIGALLAHARLVVVPSRWDNYPYTCIEAMASGVPVVASPMGGMAEMIEPGRSGWIAASASPDDLAAATRTALEAGPSALAMAGTQAAERIRTICNPERVLDRHAGLADMLIQRGAARPDLSVLAPAHVPGTSSDAVAALDRWVLEQWQRAAPGPADRATGLAATIARGLRRPARAARIVARHLRWRVAGTSR